MAKNARLLEAQSYRWSAIAAFERQKRYRLANALTQDALAFEQRHGLNTAR